MFFSTKSSLLLTLQLPTMVSTCHTAAVTSGSSASAAPGPTPPAPATAAAAAPGPTLLTAATTAAPAPTHPAPAATAAPTSTLPAPAAAAALASTTTTSISVPPTAPANSFHLVQALLPQPGNPTAAFAALAAMLPIRITNLRQLQDLDLGDPSNREAYLGQCVGVASMVP